LIEHLPVRPFGGGIDDRVADRGGGLSVRVASFLTHD